MFMCNAESSDTHNSVLKVEKIGKMETKKIKINNSIKLSNTNQIPSKYSSLIMQLSRKMGNLQSIDEDDENYDNSANNSIVESRDDLKTKSMASVKNNYIGQKRSSMMIIINDTMNLTKK